MKNILYIGNSLSNTGKTQTTIETLNEHLRVEGYTVYVFSNKKNKLLRLLDMLFAIIKYSKEVDYVLIDTYSTQNFQYAYLCSQLCRLLKLRYIPILHGGNLPNRLKSNPRLSKAIFNNAYKNVAPSLYLKSQFEKEGYSNIICIPNTINMMDYPFKQRDCQSINLLWVRSFSKIYNPLLAIEILKTLLDDGFNASLCMVGPEGDGSLKEAQQFAKDLKVEVTFTGKLSKKEWINLSENYSIFINTTNFDNMPVSLIEAMALGLPIISTNVGGLPYLIKDKHDGILVNPNNSDEFVSAIKWLVSHPQEAQDMTIQARRKAEQFDWELVKEKWYSIFD